MKHVKKEAERMQSNNIMENACEPTKHTQAAPQLWNNKVSLNLGNKMELGC